MEKLYVISTMKDGKKYFLALDSHSGGYPYWDNNLFSAKRYKSLKEAEKCVKSGDDGVFNHTCTYNMLRDLKGKIEVKIEEIVLETKVTVPFN